jgi:hypothetical protein
MSREAEQYVAMHAHVQASPASLWVGLACETSVGGNMAFIDTESVAIAILWQLIINTESRCQ